MSHKIINSWILEIFWTHCDHTACTAGPCILADQFTLSQSGGRLCPPCFCPPPHLIFRSSAIPALRFCSFRYKKPKNSALHQQSLNSSSGRASDFWSEGPRFDPWWQQFFFYKSEDNKITSCFSVGLYFTSYNPTEKWLQYHRIVLKDSKGSGKPFHFLK